MNVSAISGVISGIIFAISATWYVRDVAQRKVTASVATFFIFVIINISQLASLISEQVWHVVPFTAVGLASSILVCLLAFRNKKIYFEVPDKIGMVGALVGLVIWFVTKDAALNIYVVSIVNILTFWPLLAKSFKRPELETLAPWQLNLLASVFLMFTINSSSPTVWVVPVRQFACSLLINIALYRGRVPRERLDTPLS